MTVKRLDTIIADRFKAIALFLKAKEIKIDTYEI